jgi:hypothetical protein
VSPAVSSRATSLLLPAPDGAGKARFRLEGRGLALRPVSKIQRLPRPRD